MKYLSLLSIQTIFAYYYKKRETINGEKYFEEWNLYKYSSTHTIWRNCNCNHSCSRWKYFLSSQCLSIWDRIWCSISCWLWGCQHRYWLHSINYNSKIIHQYKKTFTLRRNSPRKNSREMSWKKYRKNSPIKSLESPLEKLSEKPLKLQKNCLKGEFRETNVLHNNPMSK